MNNLTKAKQFAILIICLVVLFALSFQNYMYIQDARIGTISASQDVNTEKLTPKELFLESWALVKSNYWDPRLNDQNWSRWKRRYADKIESEDDAYIAINSMLASLNDPYSKFMSRAEFGEQNSSIDSKIYGIGINIASISGKTYVINVIKGTPADLGGLKQGDLILNIDGKNVGGKTLFQVAQYIKGSLGQTVSIEVLRENKKITMKIKRAEIKVKTVEANFLNKDIGYIHILSFISNDTPTEFIEALNKVKSTKGLILDLRGNTGGLFQNAVFVSNLFLKNGQIVSVIGRGGNKSSYRAAKKDFVYQKPLIVLVDGESASASEIVSGALKDHKRAVIVGTNTFGKGVVQKIYSLPNKMGMNLTIARYLTPNGFDIDKKGIKPNYTVPLTKEDYIQANDRQLNFAKKLLEEELKKQKLAEKN